MRKFSQSSSRYILTQANVRVSPLKRRKVPKAGEIEECKLFAPIPREYRGGLAELVESRDIEVLVEGPMGTGKTSGILSWIYEIMDQYPGIRIAFVKKTRSTMNSNLLKTWEDYVIPAGHPMLSGTEDKMHTRKGYKHLNGSEVILIGLHDKGARDNLKGSEFDIIYCNECDQLKRSQFEYLVARLRHGVLPWRQIIADCNPDHPQHWLNIRPKIGRMKRFKTRLQDNPFYHDGTDWTVSGREYLETLEGMTGTDRRRNVGGEWCASDGAVYQHDFDDHVHVLKNGPKFFPTNWERIWSIDFGYTHPIVWQCWAIDGDGCMHLELEIYHTKLLLADFCDMIRAAAEPIPVPTAIICDHDATDRATIENHLGVTTILAWKSVRPGIDGVKQRLRVQPNGRPRIIVREDALVHPPDPALVHAGLPSCTADEFGAYSYPETTNARDEPIKEFDHGMDAMRYAVAFVDKLGTVRVSLAQAQRIALPTAGGWWQ